VGRRRFRWAAGGRRWWPRSAGITGALRAEISAPGARDLPRRPGLLEPDQDGGLLDPQDWRQGDADPTDSDGPKKKNWRPAACPSPVSARRTPLAVGRRSDEVAQPRRVWGSPTARVTGAREDLSVFFPDGKAGQPAMDYALEITG